MIKENDKYENDLLTEKIVRLFFKVHTELGLVSGGVNFKIRYIFWVYFNLSLSICGRGRWTALAGVPPANYNLKYTQAG